MSRALLPSPPPQSSLRPLPVASPSRYRLDQQLQVSGLERVLILRIQVFKLLQEAQVIQLYIWMRGEKGKSPLHRMFFLSKSLPWARCALNEVTEGSEETQRAA